MARAAQLACLLEATAEKPGNVTPRHAFPDMSCRDMLRSAVAIGPELARAGRRGVGATVLAAITATRRVVGVNTNLGIVLLLAPLVRAALDDSIRGGSLDARVGRVLRALDDEDAPAVYAAIRLAGAGGLGEGVEHDVRDDPPANLLESMASAASRDSIASEYVTGFAITFDLGLPALQRARGAGLGVREAVVQAHLELLAAVPDTLIARKRGRAVARHVSGEAARVVGAGGLLTGSGRRLLATFDGSLRGPGHTLNPGTTADLVTAATFVALLSGVL